MILRIIVIICLILLTLIGSLIDKYLQGIGIDLSLDSSNIVELILKSCLLAAKLPHPTVAASSL